MRVLHLPVNIASQISASVIGLRRKGIDAVGLAPVETFQSIEGMKSLPARRVEGGWFKQVQHKLRWSGPIVREILRADVVHWHFGSALPFSHDIKLACQLKKKLVVEFWGSDIRVPETEMSLNEWYARVWNSGRYEYQHIESRKNSHRLQKRFGERGVVALLPGVSFRDYIEYSMFRRIEHTSQRVVLDHYAPAFPLTVKSKPLVAHSPTAREIKGSDHIERAVRALQSQGLEFDFQLIQGVPHRQAVAMREACDIFVDQLNYGDYGLAAVEAMAMGKPVICFLRDTVHSRLPASCPIVSAHPGNLESALGDLLRNGQLRHDLGVAGRRYVETYHDAEKVAEQLIEIYRSL